MVRTSCLSSTISTLSSAMVLAAWASIRALSLCQLKRSASRVPASTSLQASSRGSDSPSSDPFGGGKEVPDLALYVISVRLGLRGWRSWRLRRSWWWVRRRGGWSTRRRSTYLTSCAQRHDLLLHPGLVSKLHLIHVLLSPGLIGRHDASLHSLGQGIYPVLEGRPEQSRSAELNVLFRLAPQVKQQTKCLLYVIEREAQPRGDPALHQQFC